MREEGAHTGQHAQHGSEEAPLKDGLRTELVKKHEKEQPKRQGCGVPEAKEDSASGRLA